MLDRSLALLREGYLFILRRRKRARTDAFTTRLMLKKTVCMGGTEAARLFYDAEHFQRAEAVPGFVQNTLFGRNAVQTKDGPEHLRRKVLFMRLTDEAQTQRFADLLTHEWKNALIRWKYANRPVILFKESQEIICHAICAWAGIPMSDGEARSHSRDIFAMIDAFGSVIGPRHWRGLFARRRAEKWMIELIEKARKDTRSLLPIHIVAHHRNLDGTLLDAKMAAIEMLNIIRPTVAISYYISFAAVALHEHPECRDKLCKQENYAEMFINEVRRYYPFAPFLGARAKKEFSFKECPFAKNELAVLDLYGTNHDDKIWEQPEEFRPERFLDWRDNGYELIPQGGGEAASGHRCPGEGFTIAALKVTLSMLAPLRYTVPPQDLGFSLSRMPTYPRSGVAIRLV